MTIKFKQSVWIISFQDSFTNRSNHLPWSYNSWQPYSNDHFHWLYVTITSRTRVRMNLDSIVYVNVKEIFARSRLHIWSLSDSNGSWMNTLPFNQTGQIWLIGLSKLLSVSLNGWVFVHELSGCGFSPVAVTTSFIFCNNSSYTKLDLPRLLKIGERKSSFWLLKLRFHLLIDARKNSIVSTLIWSN